MGERNQAKALPAWIQEAFDGEPTDDVLNKRSEPRYIFASSASLRPLEGGVEGTPIRVRIFNVSESGVAFVARQELPQGQLLTLHPCYEESDGGDTTVSARVIHCTQTVQGYKIGCMFE